MPDVPPKIIKVKIALSQLNVLTVREIDHPSYFRTCTKFITQREIQTVKINQTVSYSEARRIVESSSPRVGTSYAAATITEKMSRHKGTQTENIDNTTSLSNLNYSKLSPSQIIASTFESEKFTPVSRRRNMKNSKPLASSKQSKGNKKCNIDSATDPRTYNNSYEFTPLRNAFLKTNTYQIKDKK